MADCYIEPQPNKKEENSKLKQDNLFIRLLKWIGKGAKKASEIGALCCS